MNIRYILNNIGKEFVYYDQNNIAFITKILDVNVPRDEVSFLVYDGTSYDSGITLSIEEAIEVLNNIE